MKTFFGSLLVGALLGFFLSQSHFDVIDSAEAAPKYKATLAAGDGGAAGQPLSATYCFAGPNHRVTFQSSFYGEPFVVHFASQSGRSDGISPVGAPAVPAQDYRVPMVQAVNGFVNDGGWTATEVYDMSTDNCVSIGAADAGVLGSVRLYDLTTNLGPAGSAQVR